MKKDEPQLMVVGAELSEGRVSIRFAYKTMHIGPAPGGCARSSGRLGLEAVVRAGVGHGAECGGGSETDTAGAAAPELLRAPSALGTLRPNPVLELRGLRQRRREHAGCGRGRGRRRRGGRQRRRQWSRGARRHGLQHQHALAATVCQPMLTSSATSVTCDKCHRGGGRVQPGLSPWRAWGLGNASLPPAGSLLRVFT